ncbi:MAG: hypothetical protein ACP5OR_04550 [Candidatus Dormibacteria bacterium]
MGEAERIALEKRRGVLLSLMPGIGQFANGQGYKFWFYFPATLLSLGVGVGLLWIGASIGSNLLVAHDGILFLLVSLLGSVVGLLAIVLGLFFWASAAVDTYRSAHAMRVGSDEHEKWWFFHV